MESTKEKREYLIYCHQNKISKKKYFGYTGQKPRKRWQYGWQYTDKNGHPDFWEDIKKYGWDNYDHFILAKCETKKQAEKIEREYIFKYCSDHPLFGYNKACKTETIPIERDIDNTDIKILACHIELLMEIINNKKHRKIRRVKRNDEI